ncbi:MAG: hypothetical protein WBM40_00620 [Thiohalocapsa sp.]
MTSSLAALVVAAGATVAAEFERKLDYDTLRQLTGDGDKEQTTCPDDTFLCYTCCCTNSQECCTPTKGCVAVGGCDTPSPQSIRQPEKLQR